jgi:hypothetical protein
MGLGQRATAKTPPAAPPKILNPIAAILLTKRNVIFTKRDVSCDQSQSSKIWQNDLPWTVSSSRITDVNFTGFLLQEESSTSNFAV